MCFLRDEPAGFIKKIEWHKSTGPAWWTGNSYSNKEAGKITDSLKGFLENNFEYLDEEIIFWEVLVSLTIKIVYLRKMKVLIKNLHKTFKKPEYFAQEFFKFLKFI